MKHSCKGQKVGLGTQLMAHADREIARLERDILGTGEHAASLQGESYIVNIIRDSYNMPR
jgi:hypothetical protein